MLHPTDLHQEEARPQRAADLGAVRPGQMIELADGQTAVVLAALAGGLRLLRLSWPTGGVLPLGEVFELQGQGQEVKVLGAWYAEGAVPPPERVLIESIHRGFITPSNCGVPWPLADVMQLSEQAAARIERYLFEVARTTGCAFPFHDIANTIRGLHLVPRSDNPAFCDILAEDDLSAHRGAPKDADLLSFWARELRRRLHAADWVLPSL